MPHNYENDYKGAMTIANAFAESRNIPALKLAARVSIHKVIDVAHRFGVTSNIPPYLPVALGAVEITLEEQVASYAVFPNDGLRMTLAKTTDGQGGEITSMSSGWSTSGMGGDNSTSTFRFTFRDIAGVTNINATIALHKNRFFDFTAKPSKLETNNKN